MRVEDFYSEVHLPEVSKRWYKPDDLKRDLQGLISPLNFEKIEIGESFLGLPISGYLFGSGKTKVLLWSQMHGNEPTATHALLEILNFLGLHKSSQTVANWEQELSICFIPMLNPDGASHFTRENAMGIDPNRDAVSLQTPEMNGFMNFVKQWKPNWAFNLHDQRNIFNVEGTEEPATLSFLAPSANPQRMQTSEQEQSMGLISAVLKSFSERDLINMARFTDEYYPKALGEYFMRNEVPCVLMECGPTPNDGSRLTARKLCFSAICHAFEILATHQNLRDIEQYLDLPLNAKMNVDVILRNALIKTEKLEYRADIALLKKEITNFETHELTEVYELHAIGDLSLNHGLQEIKQTEVEFYDKHVKVNTLANFVLTLRGDKIIFKEGLANKHVF